MYKKKRIRVSYSDGRTDKVYGEFDTLEEAFAETDKAKKEPGVSLAVVEMFTLKEES